jgi:hypothetical protein
LENYTNFCLFLAVAATNGGIHSLPVKAAMQDAKCVPLPLELSSLRISSDIYFLQSPDPVLNFRPGKELNWLLALETFLHDRLFMVLAGIYNTSGERNPAGERK